MPSWSIRSTAQMISYDFYWFILMNILMCVVHLIFILLNIRIFLVNSSFSSFYTFFISALLKLIGHFWFTEAEGELVAGLMSNILRFLCFVFHGEYINICYGYRIYTLFWWSFRLLFFFLITPIEAFVCWWSCSRKIYSLSLIFIILLMYI